MARLMKVYGRVIFAACLLMGLTACVEQGQVKPVAGVPDDLDEVLRLARETYAAGDWRESERYYFDLSQRIPAEGESWFKLGNIYARTDRPDAAVDAYREALVRVPESAKSWHNMGVLFLREAANSFAQMNKHVSRDEPLAQRGRDIYEGIKLLLQQPMRPEPLAVPEVAGPGTKNTVTGVAAPSSVIHSVEVENTVQGTAVNAVSASGMPEAAGDTADTISVVKPVETPPESVSRAAVKPVTEAAVKPVTGAAVKPVTEAAVKPVTGAAVKPVTGAAVKPVTKAAVKPVTEAPARPVDVTDPEHTDGIDSPADKMLRKLLEDTQQGASVE